MYIPLRPGVLFSVDLWDITQNRPLTSTLKSKFWSNVEYTLRWDSKG